MRSGGGFEVRLPCDFAIRIPGGIGANTQRHNSGLTNHLLRISPITALQPSGLPIAGSAALLLASCHHHKYAQTKLS